MLCVCVRSSDGGGGVRWVLGRCEAVVMAARC